MIRSFGWARCGVAMVCLAGWSVSAQASMLLVEGSSIRRGEEGVVSIVLESDGQKNAIAFSIHFNPTLIGFLDHERGRDLPPGTMIFVNPSKTYDGKFGCLIGLQPQASLPPGRLEILRIHVHTMPGAQTLPSLIQISDDPVRRSASGPDASAVRFQSRSGAILLIGDGAATPTPAPVTPPSAGAPPPVIGQPGGNGAAPATGGGDQADSDTSFEAVSPEAMQRLHALFPGMAGLYADAEANAGAAAGGTGLPTGMAPAAGAATDGTGQRSTTGSLTLSAEATAPTGAGPTPVGPGLTRPMPGGAGADALATTPSAITEYADPYRYYDIIYKRRGRKAPALVEVTSGGIKVLPGATVGDTLKITRRANQTQTPPIRLIQSDGGFLKILTEAPVESIRLEGALGSLTARKTHVASVRALRIGSVQMTSGGGGAGAPGVSISASQPYRRGDREVQTRIALKGVVLRDLDAPAGTWRIVGARGGDPAP